MAGVCDKQSGPGVLVEGGRILPGTVWRACSTPCRWVRGVWGSVNCGRSVRVLGPLTGIAVEVEAVGWASAADGAAAVLDVAGAGTVITRVSGIICMVSCWPSFWGITGATCLISVGACCTSGVVWSRSKTVD